MALVPSFPPDHDHRHQFERGPNLRKVVRGEPEGVPLLQHVAEDLSQVGDFSGACPKETEVDGYLSGSPSHPAGVGSVFGLDHQNTSLAVDGEAVEFRPEALLIGLQPRFLLVGARN